MSIPSKAFFLALLAVSLYSGTASAQSHDSYGNLISPYYGGKGRHANENSSGIPPGEPRTYIAIQGGYNNPVGNVEDYDRGAGFSAALGYRAYELARFEVEAAYHKNDYSASGGGIDERSEIEGTSVLVNFWYDLKNSTSLTPYIGGGVGVIYGKMDAFGTDGVDTVSINDSDIRFTYQAGGGMAYELSKNFALTLDYRYIDTGDFKFKTVLSGAPVGSIDTGDYRTHELRAGVRYSF